MTYPLGIRLAALKSLSLAEAAAVAREQGIEALDFPADASAATETCREHGLRVGSVDGVAMGQLLVPADDERERALEALCAQVSALPALGTRVLFLCLNPADRTQGLWPSNHAGVVAADPQEQIARI